LLYVWKWELYIDDKIKTRTIFVNYCYFTF
jgi:hypothetical protein